jgi:hypothetical protein
MTTWQLFTIYYYRQKLLGTPSSGLFDYFFNLGTQTISGHSFAILRYLFVILFYFVNLFSFLPYFFLCPTSSYALLLLMPVFFGPSSSYALYTLLCRIPQRKLGPLLGQVLAWLEVFADHFGVTQCIRFGRRITNAEPIWSDPHSRCLKLFVSEVVDLCVIGRMNACGDWMKL